MAFDIYQAVTDRITAALEQGTIPWKKPWVGGASCISYATGRPYSLLNCILLGMKAGEWITFNQAVQAGGHVKKGEKSRLVVFWKPYETVNEETGEVEKRFYLKYYNVFHLDQTEGISPRWRASMLSHPGADLKPDAAADKLIHDYAARSGVKLTVCQSDRAFYSPSQDEVVLPQLSQYEHMEEFYSTGFHELVHSTGHRSRLNRIRDDAAFGSENYSKEELTAEIGSAFLMNHVGLETDQTFGNSAAYVKGWLKALKDDKRMIVFAAGAAEKAAKLILNEKEDDTDEADR